MSRNGYNKPGVSRAGISRVRNGSMVKAKRKSIRKCGTCADQPWSRPEDGTPCPGCGLAKHEGLRVAS